MDETKREYNLSYCNTMYKLIYLKRINPIYGDTEAIDVIRESAKILAKIAKAKTLDDKLKLVQTADTDLTKFLTENVVVFPLEPQILATNDKKGELIESHFSVDTLEDRKVKIQDGYIVRREHVCTATHTLTEWGFSWIA